jgi:UDP-N-acetylmuramoylalanine--D-glutamate ligase
MNNMHNSMLQVMVGLGKTGASCVRYLRAQGLNVAVTDSRPSPPGLADITQQFPEVVLSLGKFDEELCRNAARLIVSPGVPLEEPAIANAKQLGVPIIGDIELFALQAKAPVVAITGSNGKSTVTTLVGLMAQDAGLNVRVGGNLGTPALELLSESEPDLYVLELSSFQLETTYSLQAKAAVLLNLSADHMDRHHSLAAYLAAKQRVYHQCQTAIINRDDPTTWQNLTLPNTISFGLDAPAANQFGLRIVNNETCLARGDEPLIATHELKIRGRHQLANALAALALGEAIGLPITDMRMTLRSFHGLAHRCQWVATLDGVDWYNDSKATNIGAAQAAIEGLGAEIKGKTVVIAGGLGKDADFRLLRDTMQRYTRALVLIGKDAPLIEAALTGSTAIYQATSLEHAVALARQQAHAGDAVILAPACASFDMFDNFEHRGETFMSLVRALA